MSSKLSQSRFNSYIFLMRVYSIGNPFKTFILAFEPINNLIFKDMCLLGGITEEPPGVW